VRPARPAHRPMLDRMKRFLRFTFERESHWMLVLYVLLPLLAILFSIVIPALRRRWFG